MRIPVRKFNSANVRIKGWRQIHHPEYGHPLRQLPSRSWRRKLFRPTRIPPRPTLRRRCARRSAVATRPQGLPHFSRREASPRRPSSTSNYSGVRALPPDLATTTKPPYPARIAAESETEPLRNSAHSEVYHHERSRSSAATSSGARETSPSLCPLHAMHWDGAAVGNFFVHRRRSSPALRARSFRSWS